MHTQRAPHLSHNALDHLDVGDLELGGVRVQQRGQEGVHRVAMQHSARPPKLKRLPGGGQVGRRGCGVGRGPTATHVPHAAAAVAANHHVLFQCLKIYHVMHPPTPTLLARTDMKSGAHSDSLGGL